MESHNNNPIPADGEAIQVRAGKFSIPDNPIIPFIEGDGVGPDIWKAARTVFDAARAVPTRGDEAVAHPQPSLVVLRPRDDWLTHAASRYRTLTLRVNDASVASA